MATEGQSARFFELDHSRGFRTPPWCDRRPRPHTCDRRPLNSKNGSLLLTKLTMFNRKKKKRRTLSPEGSPQSYGGHTFLFFKTKLIILQIGAAQREHAKRHGRPPPPKNPHCKADLILYVGPTGGFFGRANCVGLYQRKQLATIVDRDRTRAALLHSYILCILVGGLVMAFAAPVDNFGFTAR